MRGRDRASRGEGVRPGSDDFDVWQALIVCSNCVEEVEVEVDDLDELEREVCACGYSFVVLSVAEFEPVRVPQPA